MGKYGLLRELADNNALQFIETTSATNGYPQDLKPALIGFNDYEEAEEFAQEHGLQTYIFHKRNGWQLWQRSKPAYEPMTITSDDYGDDYNMFTHDELDGYFDNEVKPRLDSFDDIESLKTFVDEQEIIMEELDLCNENEAVITYCGDYYDTVKVKSIEWSHDTHHYVIGVM
jgi:hypothetical protein